MEIVINGISHNDIANATKKYSGYIKFKIKKDIVAVSAGNYGGKLDTT